MAQPMKEIVTYVRVFFLTGYSGSQQNETGNNDDERNMYQRLPCFIFVTDLGVGVS